MKDNKFWDNKAVLITGANGFLASHLTAALLRKKAKVIGVIKYNVPSLLDSDAIKRSAKLKIIKGDIVDYPFVKKCMKAYKPQFCFHLAAQAIVGKANKRPIPTFKTNIQGTWNLLEAIREASPATKIIVASSDKAYGEHKKLPYMENAALQALHPYDASKACADILARTYAHTYNLSVAVSRCANIYGPGDTNFSRIIPDTMRSVLLGKDPVIRSDGTPIRDYIYIEDVVEAYLALAKALYLSRPGVNGEPFNFGTGRPISVLRLVKMMIKISGNRKLKPRILSKTKIKGEIDRQYLSSGKAVSLLKWRARHGIAEGLKKTFVWHKERCRKWA
ncbi:MAG: GDP-mannose 4,6-dehydratase [Candidatus Omnitrophica bacterium]|nr:GDP-mannose 4,6-dehydratase [Candidatus Omnitrophota bacterium]MDD5552667.1 GDP-mannose 4,6-dehydratase [Candidatus Omnitrophota bacterium]